MRKPEICRPLGWRCGHFRIADPVLKTRLPRKSLVIVSLMANNSDISKIHFVVVFVDMGGDLRVAVKHGNSPFVFRYPSFK